jgi:hypothetical protein
MRSNLKDQLAQLRAALLSPTPEAIGACLAGLAEAVAETKDVSGLEREIQSIKKLIEHGEKMNRGLAKILGEQIAGYTMAGTSEPIPVMSTISIEG